MLTAITGVLAGIVHVLAGPDHLAAVAPLAVSDQQRGWMAGWTWGFGHAAGVVVVAVVAVLLRDALPPIEVISAWSERVVGVALMAIGAWAFRRSARIRPARHVHGAVVHDHLHVQAGPGWIRRLGHAHAAFCLGILHGVAGSSHFFGVLPALALPSRESALLYIACFGAGTVAAMTVFAATVGAIGARAAGVEWAQRGMLLAASALAFSAGAWWLLVGV